MRCPCKAHDMRVPAPMGEPSPCCRGAKLMPWLPEFSQYAICRLQDVLGRVVGGCRAVWWHDGARWVEVSYEDAERLERLV